MKSKIIKVSIMLIFMMFSAGLFNFCFAALTEGIDYTILESNSWEYDSSLTIKLNVIDLNVSFRRVEELTDTEWKNLFTSNFRQYENYHLYMVDRDGNLLCFINRNENYRWKFMVGPTAIYLLKETDVRESIAILKYDFDLQTWNRYGTSSTGQSLPGGTYNIVNGATKTTVYLGSSTSYSSGSIIYEPITTPTDEELVTNCDFKVNFKFAPKSEEFPTDNIGTRWSWPCRLLLQHSMTNWENYNVKVKLSVIDKTQPNGLYYDLYNSEGEEIKKKGHIKEAFLSEEINNGDFFLMFTDNLQDTFKLEYEIYNKSNELLMIKSYTFKFTKSGLTYYNSTGTIIEEQTNDANGNDMSSENNSFDTNGYDNTNNNNDNDYYDVSNLNNLVSSANDTINLAQKCFAILPGFIWAMVGIFLSVCIALRILGR